MAKLIALLLFVLPAAWAQDKIITIYQDADLSNHLQASKSIQLGMELAFQEVNYEIEGYQVKFKYLDHRGNVLASKRNYKKFLKDPTALVIFSGNRSPPIIKNRAFINENEALTLVPWAAGGPVTKYPSTENFVFRLSVDDTRSGEFFIKHALEKRQCKSPHLLLEKSPWGDSNFKNLSKALTKRGYNNITATRFGWNLSERTILGPLNQIIESGSECIILVANAVEGPVIARAMLQFPAEKRIPIISHWGITGGEYHLELPHQLRDQLDVSFIQTCFSFTNKNLNNFQQNVFNKLTEYTNGDIKNSKDLLSPIGFIHSYDLTKILITAIKQSGLSGDVKKDRRAIKTALENLHFPVQGLVKYYSKPFSVFDKTKNPNAHEALHPENYCMAEYSANDEIIMIED